MLRTHTCGELRMHHIGQQVTLSGWLSVSRDLGGLTFIDLRDRFGITQLVFDVDKNTELCNEARNCGREFVLQATGIVRERSSKNLNRPTGEVEIEVNKLIVLNHSKVPPFTIEDQTDGGEDIRMKYRYLDLRRNIVQNNLIFRSNLAFEARQYLHLQEFIEVETPFLIKSTPEGARDFVVPSRLNPGNFYALPQSPQTFKQLLMVSGFDRYFQLVKCFRDEDLRADRQPEFTQIDCELSFVERSDILNIFEGLTKHLFQKVLNISLNDFPIMTYDEALTKYGSDKPDIRFEMQFHDVTSDLKGYGFSVFDQSEHIIGIVAKNCQEQFSNKTLKELTDWVQRPQIGASGLVYIKWTEEGIKSSIGKYYSDDVLENIAKKIDANQGDMILLLSGEKTKTQKQMNELRLEMGSRLGLRSQSEFKPLWVVDFPLLEWDEEADRFFAMHHPFTSPKPEDAHKMTSQDVQILSNIKADAYDLVINGVEIGGGSIRIHDRSLQSKNFDLLGFSKDEAMSQFGFLLNAFEYGAPPHGGIAFGFDRLCAVMNGVNSIRDFIAFPKNNQGKDVMIEAPSNIDAAQLNELSLEIKN